MEETVKGLCRCGCGQPTSIAKRNRYELGHRKGEPVSFVVGHQGRENLDPRERAERAKASRKKYRAAHLEQERERTRLWSQRNKEHVAAYQRTYKRTYCKSTPERREKALVRSMVTNRIASGSITRGCCEVCQASEAQAHHDDYSKPLAVRWLCFEHHRELHAKEGETT